MTGRWIRILIAVTAVSGFLGGAASNLLLRVSPAVAQGMDHAAVQEVRAERFVVVDRDGREKAVLALSETDTPEPSLTLFDQGGTGRAILCLVEGEPIIVFADEADKGSTGRAVLAVVEGEPMLRLADEDGNDRVVLGGKHALNITTGAEAELPPFAVTLLDEAGNLRWQAP